MSKTTALIAGLVILTLCSFYGFLNAVNDGAPHVVISILGITGMASILGAVYLHNKNRLAH